MVTFLQISSGKRIPLPAPDYDRLFLELEVELILERERREFALTSEPEELLGLFGILRREDLMEKATEVLAAGEPISRPLLDALIWTRPPARKPVLWPSGGAPDFVTVTDRAFDRPASPTSFLAIPPEKRISLPWCPDYEGQFRKALEDLHYLPGRRWSEAWFQAKREAKLRRRAFRKWPAWKRRWAMWERERDRELAAIYWAEAMSPTPKTDGASTESPAGPSTPWTELL